MLVASALGQLLQNAILVALRFVVELRIQQVGQLLVLLLKLVDDRLLVATLVEECCCMRLKLTVHRVGRVQLIIAHTKLLLDDGMLPAEVFVGTLNAVKVAQLRCELGAHSRFERVQAALKRPNIRLTLIHAMLLICQVSA